MNTEEPSKTTAETGTESQPASEQSTHNKIEVRVDPETGKTVRYYHGVRQIPRDESGPLVTLEMVNKIRDEMDFEDYMEEERSIAERFLDDDAMMRDA
ncbi:MAG TPA: hypothetical protein VFQ54_04710 [Thermomicrobiales bacterium]|nr:hypothetical protein [Thermomicrobiales bacterium]